MKTLTCVAAALLALGQFASAQIVSSPALISQPISNSNSAAVDAAVKANFARLPLSFEANQGQTDGQVKFLSRGQGYSLFLTGREAVLALHKIEAQPVRASGSKPVLPAKPGKTDVVRMELAGALNGLRIAGEETLPGKANYFIGSDPSKWHTNVPTYSRVKYSGVYPGIDLIYYGNQQQLEYDFVVAPNADPKQARLHFEGASQLKLNRDGDLKILAKDVEIAFHKPVVYQRKDGQRQAVQGSFKLVAKNTVGFEIGSYDHSRELVVDPVLAYSTYLGGSATSIYSYNTYAGSIAVDGSGNAYVTGSTEAADFPITSGAYQSSTKGSGTIGVAFITKFNSTGTGLIYSTFLSGSEGSGISAIKLDSAGDAYVAGATISTDFPATAGAFQPTNHCVQTGEVCANGFITELNPEGSALIFSTYLGGSKSTMTTDGVAGLALDINKNIYVTGVAASKDFPVTPGAFQTINRASGKNSTANAFLSKLSADGSKLIYSTYLGGSGIGNLVGDSGSSVVVDSSGLAYVAGYTCSPNFPVTSGSLIPVYNGGYNGAGFLTKFNADGSALIYSTYISGSTHGYPGSVVDDIALDSSGNAYIAGATGDTGFPVTADAFQKTRRPAGTYIGFVSKINPSGTAFVYSTYLGGNYTDTARRIAVDANGQATISGVTSDDNFPVTADAFQSKNAAYGVANSTGENAFLTRLNSDASGLIYSTYLGGTYNTQGGGVAIDSQGDAYLAGTTYDNNFPVTVGAFQTSFDNNQNNFKVSAGFVSKFYFGTIPAPAPTTTTLTSSPNPAGIDIPVTYTATVSSGGTTVGGGTVNFLVNGNSVATVNLDGSGTATYTNSYSAPANLTVTANYSGITTELPPYLSSSATLTQTIASQIAAPTFAQPTADTSDPVQQVAIETSVAGASIYYTINGATPTPSSTLYTHPITILGTMKIQAIAFFNGVSSAVSVATYTSAIYPESPVINFSNGFPSGSKLITTNGSAQINSSQLLLTTNQKNQAGSSFYATPVNVQSFTTDFIYNISNNVDAADGFTFTIQNAGPNALGGDGAGLGFATIQKSLCVKFDIYDNVGEGSNSTGLFLWGKTPTIPAVTVGSNLDRLIDGNLAVHLTYDGKILTLTITDLSRGNTSPNVGIYNPYSFSYSWPIDIPATVGGPTAYVGFTGSTGGGTVTTAINSWTYAPGKPASPKFAQGFDDGNGVYSNGFTLPVGGAMQLTSGLSNEQSSLFFPNAQNIQSFTSQFTFQISDPAGDGLTFAIHRDYPTILGGLGGGLGYNTIPNSVGLKFDLYNNAGEGPDSTGIYIGGALPTLPAIDLIGTGIDLHSGDPMTVDLSYNGTVLTMTITDQITKAQYTHPFTIDIPAAVGGSTAFIGFTGATGGATSTQSILNWTFTPES